MSHLPWLPPHAHGSAAGGDSEIEALQTDVMRFMAILGLCLMAIFSLVQSMPYQAEQQTPQLESKELLETEVQQLQESAAQLQEQIQQLNAQLRQAQQAKKQLENLEQDVEEQRGRLSALQKTMQHEQKALSDVRKKLEREKRIHKQQQDKLAKIDKKKVPEKPVKPAKPVKQDTPAKPKSEKKGFSLRFSSDQALLHLLRQQKLSMYVMMGKNAWRIKPQSGNWQAEKTQSPSKYYQMSITTVPNHLRKAAQRQLSVHDSSQVIWAVDLPQTMVSSLNNLMTTKQGGDLVITQSGQVQLE